LADVHRSDFLNIKIIFIAIIWMARNDYLGLNTTQTSGDDR